MGNIVHITWLVNILNIIYNSLYYIAAALLLSYWAVDLNAWIHGVILGWFFHMVVCSVILHKYITHRTYKVSSWLHPVLLYIASLNLNGSPLAWANLHRLHHATSDSDSDPHNPKKVGFLNSLFVMRLFANQPSTEMILNLKNCRDLTTDKWHKFFHNHLYAVVFGTYLIIGLIDYKWLVTLLIGTAVSFIGLFFTTYVYHFNIPVIHYRNHATTDNSHNNWLSTIIFPGEAYHNNHHNDASSFNPTERWFEFDISALIINLIRKR